MRAAVTEASLDVTPTEASSGKEYRLSPQQRRTWRQQPSDAWLTAGVRLRLARRPSAQALQRALSGLGQRHPVLRYAFANAGATEAEPSLPRAVLCGALQCRPRSSSEAAERHPAVRQVSSSSRGPRSTSGNQVSYSLSTGSAGTTELLVESPALNADSKTWLALAAELGSALSQVAPPSTPDGPDFGLAAEWQNQLLDDGASNAESPQPADPRLAFEQHRGEFAIGQHPVVIDVDLSSRLEALSDTHAFSFESALLLAFSLVLARVSGEAQFRVGVLRDERWYAELEHCLGPLSAVAPVTVSVWTEGSLFDNWARLALQLEASRSEQSPSLWQCDFEPDLRGQDPLDRDRAPCAAQFEFIQVPQPRIGADAFQIEEVFNHLETFKLKLSCTRTPGGLRATLFYDACSVLADEAQLFSERIVTLLEQLLEEPSLPCHAANCLGPREREILMRGGLPDNGHEPADLVSWFERVALRYPNRVAVQCGSDALTYRELDARATHIAGALQRRGIGPESRVALCMDRSVELIASLLGVVKAGAAYVPLDPQHPDERLCLLTERTRAALVIADSTHVTRFNGPSLATYADLLADPSAARIAATHGRTALYVIHTSGSTGVPNGVIVERDQMLSYLLALQKVLPLPELRSWASVTTVASDLGNTAIFGALCFGATLHLVPKQLVLDAVAFGRYVRENGIEALKITPSHLSALLDADPGGAALPERFLVLGGESTSWELFDRVSQVRPRCTVVNHYGPTETTVGVIAQRVQAEPRGWSSTVPLGIALRRASAHVLDDALRPALIGVAGELYLGGPQVSRGYFGNPRKTAASFVPDPFSQRSGRLYRTGDRARVLPDGSVEFLGRRDQQLKIRGYRVELNEVAASLRRQPRVRDALVRVSGEGTQRRLIGYVVPSKLDATLEGQLVDARVDEWRQVFAETHAALARQAATTFTTHGWVSSYTQQELPPAEIQEQVDAITQRVLSWHPETVLEVGCGTGLLLTQIAEHCSRYVGTDFAPELLAFVRRTLADAGPRFAHVQLMEQPAHTTETLPDAAFDVIVLNSVIQYFPSLDYLRRVLAGLAPKLRPGGRIFLGDVRSFPLLEAFHASVQVARAESGTSLATLAEAVEQKCRLEGELVIAPRWFQSLTETIPELGVVEARLKRGHFHNELTCYRYDVVLHSQQACRTRAAEVEHTWGEQLRSPDDLERWLGHTPVDCVWIRNLPNRRVVVACALGRALSARDPRATVDDLRSAAANVGRDAYDPEDFIAAAARAGFDARAHWGSEAHCFDVSCVRRSVLADGTSELVVLSPSADVPIEHEASNDPLFERYSRVLAADLKRALAAELPDYMVPSALVFLRRFTLTENGKIDTSGLPEPAQFHRHSREYVPPRSETEAKIAAIWAEVLALSQVGAEDDFFELGGHSLLATQVVARMRSAFQAELPLSAFFEGNPTPAKLAKVIEALRRDRTLDAGEPEPQELRLSRRPTGVSRVPTGFAQERILRGPDPEHPAFNVPFAFYLDGALDERALLEGIRCIIARHEALRTRILSTDAGFLQEISEQPGFDLEWIDLSQEPEPKQRAIAQQLAQSRGKGRFDLANGPLIRVVLLRLGNARHALILSVHHVVSDGWSTGLFCRELSELYTAASHGSAARLPALAVNYADYCAWQRKQLNEAELARLHRFWSAELAGSSFALDIAPGRARPNPQNYCGAGLDVALPKALSAGLQQLAQASGATLFMTLLALYDVVLAKLSGQSDFVVGTPIANRRREELEPLLGCFINCLVLRCRIEAGLSFRQLLEGVKQTCLRAYEHQDYPFSELARAVQDGRGPAPKQALDPARPPLFQVMFELFNTPTQTALKLGDLRLSPLEFVHGTSEFELNLILREGADGLRGWLLYRTHLFSEQEARWIVSSLEHVARQVLAHPDAPLASLELAPTRSHAAEAERS
ncbi:MAG TPA: amino acid adenylation domain-containing protein [Polyangiaceae bacterium]|nr:amino acid adenylation domain-containing protein [Polyangiaceae bacterium]